ncbi:DUF927 domain-containing protein [Lysobacter sp. KIS68-7]|uniref:DUF927 domain-containing protein n=1 Tax=Lysobacter sp. KIS68-7 TaxID=2904252 RepID=UPI001E487D61|nr:DUF927 domain-containing protein [Lysobacter sp. KIS68-7]UHQ19012.1 DUF927 domain-containing protein [Lysobacter sp. KIS68-7]
MTSNEKPAGGNLRVVNVDAAMGTGRDTSEGTRAPADYKQHGRLHAPPTDRSDGDETALADSVESEAARDGGVSNCSLEVDRDSRDSRDIEQTQSDEVQDRVFVPRGARFELYEGVRGLQDGVHWIGVERDRKADELVELDPEWVCSPLRIAATTQDGSGNNWGRLLTFVDRAGMEHRWAMPMEMLAGTGDALRSELLRQGLEITSNPRLRGRLSDFIQRENPSISARCVTRTGWDGDVFALPDRTYGDCTEGPVIFQTSTPDGIALSQRGTLDEWRSRIALPCAGNSRLVLALSCAFAGPCLGLAGAEGGGLHLRGSSSVGKTTALSVAASVFGPPRFARTWRQTDNAIEGVASMHSDLLLILDEIAQLDPKHAGACAYLLANGQGKGRSRRDGSPRSAAVFRVLFLSSGEIGLHELISEVGGKVRAGQEVRVIDVPADAGSGLGIFDLLPEGITAGAFADRLKAASADQFGWPLIAFLETVTADLDGARMAIKATSERLARALADETADGQVRRVAQRFALIGAAGELATAFGLTGWEPGEAEHAVAVCFNDWQSARGGKGNAEPAAMLAQVRKFLELHGESRFTVWNDPYAKTVNRAGFRRQTADGPEYYIEREVFTSEVLRGFDAREAVRVLIACGALMPDADGVATRTERLPDDRRVRVYRITPAIWQVEL